MTPEEYEFARKLDCIIGYDRVLRAAVTELVEAAKRAERKNIGIGLLNAAMVAQRDGASIERQITFLDAASIADPDLLDTVAKRAAAIRSSPQ